jgi:hypothetical protein
VVDVIPHIARYEFTAGVVAVWVVGLQDAQAIFDGQARGDDEEPSAEVLAAGMAHRIDRPPPDEHGITVVLPAPVANFNARRISSGLASPICASWNQMASWLRAVDGLRRAA